MNIYIHEELIHAIVDSCERDMVCVGDSDMLNLKDFLDSVSYILDSRSQWVKVIGLVDIDKEALSELVRCEVNPPFRKNLYDFIINLWELYDINLDILKKYFDFILLNRSWEPPYSYDSLESFKNYWIGRENEQHISSSWMITFNVEHNLIPPDNSYLSDSELELTSDEEDETPQLTIKENIIEMRKTIEDIQDNNGIMKEGDYLIMMNLCKAIYDQS